MQGQADSWPHLVEMEVPREGFEARLRVIEAWLQEWEISHRVGSTLAAKGTIRICFSEESFARAFVSRHGGRLLPDDEIARAMLADQEDAESYRRLADEYGE